MPRASASGIAVVILAAAVGVGWAGTLILSAFVSVDERALALLDGLGQMIVEGLVIYIAYQVGAGSRAPALA